MTEPIRPSTKDAIMEAAFELLSRNLGASLAEIAERAGVGRATLHRYFASREDLMRTLAMTALKEMDAAAEDACADATSYAEAARRTLEALIPLGDRHGFLTREPLEDDPAIAAEFERQISETRDMVDGAKSEGVFDRAVPTAWIAQAYDHLLFAAWESVKAGEATPAQAADLAWRTLTTGLAKDKQ